MSNAKWTDIPMKEFSKVLRKMRKQNKVSRLRQSDVGKLVEIAFSQRDQNGKVDTSLCILCDFRSLRGPLASTDLRLYEIKNKGSEIWQEDQVVNIFDYVEKYLPEKLANMN